MNFTKTLVAAALLAGAASANAANLAVSDRGNINYQNQLFIQVYNPDFVNADGSLGATYNTGLGIAFSQFRTEQGFNSENGFDFQGAFSLFNTAAFATAIGSGINLGLDPLFQTIVGTGSNIIYQIGGATTGFLNSDPISGQIETLVTGAGTVEQNSDVTADFTGEALSLIDRGNAIVREQRRLGNVASYIIADQPFDPLNPQGQYNDPTSGSLADVFGGIANLAGNVGLGLDTNVFFTSQEIVRDQDGNPVGVSTTDNTIFNVGDFNLSAAGLLTFTPAGVSQVPLPAAVWMFGAGLMGVLRLTRRKAA